MIKSFIAVLVTQNLQQQQAFYQDILKLELLFNNVDTLGLGKNNQLYNCITTRN